MEEFEEIKGTTYNESFIALLEEAEYCVDSITSVDDTWVGSESVTDLDATVAATRYAGIEYSCF